MIQILVVEDEKAISDLIRLNLTKAGYGVTIAYTGMEAADILETENFDLIILDVMLPELDGFELMEYIRPLKIPVIYYLIITNSRMNYLPAYWQERV